jgi:Flp pilus assembly protein TadD
MKSAIIHFTEANNRFANNSEILRHLGWAYVVDGEHARGVMFLRRAYTLAPKDQRVGEDLGVSLLTDPVGTEKTIAEWLHILAESGNSERAEEFFRYMETGILEK